MDFACNDFNSADFVTDCGGYTRSVNVDFANRVVTVTETI